MSEADSPAAELTPIVVSDADLAKIAIDDVRQRLKAQNDLMLQVDRQAMAFFGFSLTAAIATGTAVGAFAWVYKSPLIAAGLALCCIGFLLAAGISWHALRSVKIHLPGREAEFWQWALEHRSADPVRAYLHAAKTIYEENREIGNAGARLASRARNVAAGSVMLATALVILAALILF